MNKHSNNNEHLKLGKFTRILRSLTLIVSVTETTAQFLPNWWNLIRNFIESIIVFTFDYEIEKWQVIVEGVEKKPHLHNCAHCQNAVQCT